MFEFTCFHDIDQNINKSITYHTLGIALIPAWPSASSPKQSNLKSSLSSVGGCQLWYESTWLSLLHLIDFLNISSAFPRSHFLAAKVKKSKWNLIKVTKCWSNIKLPRRKRSSVSSSCPRSLTFSRNYLHKLP